MVRESFYDRLNKDNDYKNEIEKLCVWFLNEKICFDYSQGEDQTCAELLDSHISWCNTFRGYQSSFESMIKKLGYGNGISSFTLEECIPLLELMWNCLRAISQNFKKNRLNNIKDSFAVAVDTSQKLITDLHLTEIKNEADVSLLIDASPVEHIAAESLQDDGSFQMLLEYRHHTMKENIEGKKSILSSLWTTIEPETTVLKGSEYSQLLNDLLYMLNNYDIRHGNKTGLNENPVLHDMSGADIEQAYDATFSLLVDIIMACDYVQNSKPYIKELKAKGNMTK